MENKKHIKHPFVQKPSGGKFHRNEFAFLGAPCGVIQQLCEELAHDMSDEFRMGYVDADHGESDINTAFKSRYTDKISHHNFEFEHVDLTYKFKSLFYNEDAVLVNGNHFVAASQIVIINEKKKESLSRKLDRMTNVVMILLDEGMNEVFDFVQEAIPNYGDIPKFDIKDTKGIAKTLNALITSNQPKIKGLVFAGGQSVRMGTDKGALEYHGKPQREYAADLLGRYCEDTYISVQGNPNFASEYDFLRDSFSELGPFGGLLSAFRSNPNSAWMAVACDLPMLDEGALEQLYAARNISKLATCFHNPMTDFPEPMITIWEPKAYPVLLNFLSLGYSCPRKVLINSDVEVLDAKRPEILTNVNTPEDFKKVKETIGK